VAAYWFSNFVMDVGKHVIPSIFSCLMIIAFSMTSMTENGNYGAMWILFFLYGWAIIPFSYMFSFLFKQQGNSHVI
jgi:ATP-binding cassette subfamily A (ABC1) protein 3